MVGVHCSDCGGDVDIRVLDHEPTERERSEFENDNWSRCRQITLAGPLEANGDTISIDGDADFHKRLPDAPTVPEQT
jgi:hypothetical protein